MIDATSDEGEVDGDGEGSRECQAQRKLTDEQVVGQAIGFLLAGYETTANTLAYTSYLLALNPDIQEKLQSEIDSYFDEKPVGCYNYIHFEKYFLHGYCTSGCISI